MAHARRLLLCLVAVVTIGLMLHTSLNLSFLVCTGAGQERGFLKDRADRSLLIDDSVARALSSQMSVLCWVPSTENRLDTKIRAVNETWVPRCDAHVYFINTNSSNVTSDVIRLDAPEGYYNLTKKSMAAFEYLYHHHRHDYDWFLKGDDDAYIVMENLRFLLSHYDPTTPVYLGHLYKGYHKSGYMSGGASYVLSKEALRVLYDEGISKNKCSSEGLYEDVEVGKCIHAAGVASHASRDTFGRDLFHPLQPQTHIVGPIPLNQLSQDRFSMVSGSECCGQLTVSFHKVDPKLMRVMDHLLYRTSLYGRQPDLHGMQRLIRPGAVPPLE